MIHAVRVIDPTGSTRYEREYKDPEPRTPNAAERARAKYRAIIEQYRTAAEETGRRIELWENFIRIDQWTDDPAPSEAITRNQDDPEADDYTVHRSAWITVAGFSLYIKIDPASPSIAAEVIAYPRGKEDDDAAEVDRLILHRETTPDDNPGWPPATSR